MKLASLFEGENATNDGWGPDTTVKFTVEVASVTVAQHIEGRGEPSNAVLDLSVSARAHILDSDGKLESRKLRAGTHGITVHVGSLESFKSLQRRS